MWMFPERLTSRILREWNFFVLLDTYLARLGFVLHQYRKCLFCYKVGMDTAYDGGIF